MSYLRPLLSITFVNRNALRSFSAMPPRNCQRTSGCISVSLLIGRSTRMRSPASSSAFRCSCRSRYARSLMSLHRDVVFANQTAPFFLLRLDEFAERLGRAADDVAALRFEPLAHRRIGEHLRERTVQRIEHALRRLRRRESGYPGLRFEAGVGLANRRYARPELGALGRAHRERHELARFHVLGDGAAALDKHHLYHAGDEIAHRRPAAAIVDRHALDARDFLEQFIREAARGRRTRRAVV